MTGIFPPDAGTVTVDGEPVYENPAVKEKTGYVADSNQMFGSYRVSKLVSFYEDVYKSFSREDFNRLNRVFRVDMKKRISQLSKGQQMRVSFMLNMARNPEIMILDEPTSSLDPELVTGILDIIKKLAREHERTMLIVTHEMRFAREVADRILFMDDGVIIEEGKPEQIFTNPQNDRTRKFLELLQ